MDIKIDESSHKATPTIFQKIKYTLCAIGLGVILLQVMLFAISPLLLVSIVVIMDSPYFYGYVIICAILGWLVGEKFNSVLSDNISKWLDIGFWWKL